MNDDAPREIEAIQAGAACTKLSTLTAAIGFQACQRFTDTHRLPPIGGVDERGTPRGDPHHASLSMAQATYRAELSDTARSAIAKRLRVPISFLREFNLGWCSELDAATIGTIDETWFTAGVELLLPRDVSGMLIDQPQLHGVGGLVAIPRSRLRLGAPLVVSGDWKYLHACWRDGKNVAYKATATISAVAARAIQSLHDRTGHLGGRHEIDHHSWHETKRRCRWRTPSAVARLSANVWQREIERARSALGSAPV